MRIRAEVLLRDYEGRVLVASTVPEGDETPLEAAERGLAETLGVHRRPGHLLLVDALPGELVLVFDGGRLDDLGDTGGQFVDVSEAPTRIATIVSETGLYAENGVAAPGAGWGAPLAES